MQLIRQGDAGPEVLDVQQRLDDLGLPSHDPPGRFEDGTLRAVRAFQQARGLVADGIVGPDTWRSLVEAGLSLGDRLLYETRPMLRGDDVRELQERLNRLGFDSGHVDGIFGPDTATALMDFQLNIGLDPDGKVGAATVDALRRLHRDHQAVPASAVRERYRLGERVRLRSLAGVPIMIDPGNGPDDPGYRSPDGVWEHQVTWEIGSRVAGRLAALGARPILSRGPATTPDPSQRAALANDEDVALILSIHTNGLDSGAARGAAAHYFGSSVSTSEHGRQLAELALEHVIAATGTPDCRAHPSTSALLRESRAVAVILEIGFLTHPQEGRELADPRQQHRISGALVDAVRDYLLA